MVRILIADDHDLVRETIASFLVRSDGVEEVETVGNLQDALQKVVEASAFDLVMLDLNMPGMNGLDGLKQMKVANEPKPVAILSGTATPSVAQDAIAFGAIGFVPKTLSSKSISNAIGLMVSGEVFAPFDLMQSSSSASPIDGLTSRETEVLQGLYEGKSNKEIARDLDLQEVTIKLHVKTLCRKLSVKNRTQAAIEMAKLSIGS